MSYQVFARKWRPKNFSEVAGQGHVLKALENALDENRIHHAYLFTGTRGIGKTTLARIIAKCLNCDKGVSSTPCGECASCTAIATGNYFDLIEVDAASKTKVEDTRSLLENVPFAPSTGRYKVYLIDEVHMLSGHSFNALLKTLEEPPAHVVFILATTEPDKLPVTVLSRCLKLHLKHLSEETVQAQLEKILNSETIDFETPALRLIAQAAKGSMRDALSLLEQAVMFTPGKLSEQSVRDMLGLVDSDVIFNLINALAAKSSDDLLKYSAEAADLTDDFAGLLTQMLEVFHGIALIQTCGSLPSQSHNTELLKTLAEAFSKEYIQLLYQIALIGQEDLAKAPNPKLGFEMVLLRMLAFEPTKIGETLSATEAKPSLQASKPTIASKPPVQTQTQTQSGSAPVKLNSAPQVEPIQQQAKSKPHTVSPETSLEPTQPQPDGKTWSQVVGGLNLTGIPQMIAANSILIDKTDTRVTLKIKENFLLMLTEQIVEKLAAALSDYWQTNIAVVIYGKDDTHTKVVPPGKLEQITAAPPASKQSPSNDLTPKETWDNKALELTQEIAGVASLLDTFDGKIAKAELKDKA